MRRWWTLAGLLVFVARGQVTAAPPGQPAPTVPGISDTVVVIIGTVISLLVIYAIAAAHFRKED